MLTPTFYNLRWDAIPQPFTGWEITVVSPDKTTKVTTGPKARTTRISAVPGGTTTVTVVDLPDRHSSQSIEFVDQEAQVAFPTTSVIDSGTGADDPSPMTGWTTDNNMYTTYRSGATNTGIERLSNQFKAEASGWQLSYRTSETTDEDCEVYCTIDTLGADGDEILLFARMQSIGASWAGYRLKWAQNAGTSFDFQLAYVSGGNAVTLATTTTDPGTAAVGDKFGLECIGSSIKAWYYDGSSWSNASEINTTDSTVTGGGKLGLEIRNTTARVSGFGGGTVVAASTNSRYMMTLGVG